MLVKPLPNFGKRDSVQIFKNIVERWNISEQTAVMTKAVELGYCVVAKTKYGYLYTESDNIKLIDYIDM